MSRPKPVPFPTEQEMMQNGLDAKDATLRSVLEKERQMVDYETAEVKPPKNFETRATWIRSELPDGTIVFTFHWWRWLWIKLTPWKRWK